MIQNIFKKLNDNFSKKSNVNIQDYSKPNNFKTGNKEPNNKVQILKIEGNQYDINSLDKESKKILELYEISNIKIKFFKNLLKQLKVNRNLKIIELKSKLKKENSLT